MRRLITATAATAVLVAGCGPAENGDVTADPPSEQSGPAIELTVEVSGAGRSTWRLQCEPAGGDHPNAASACERLQDLGREEAFAPVPKDMQCTMIYGGPQVASVTGHWGQQQVDARFERTNGCEISRWEALVPLLPKI